MEIRISATEARVHFGELMRKAQKVPVVVEKSGVPQVVVMSKRAYDQLARETPRREWESLLQEFHEKFRDELVGRDLPPVEEVLRQVREDRDEELASLR